MINRYKVLTEKCPRCRANLIQDSRNEKIECGSLICDFERKANSRVSSYSNAELSADSSYFVNEQEKTADSSSILTEPETADSSWEGDGGDFSGGGASDTWDAGGSNEK